MLHVDVPDAGGEAPRPLRLEPTAAREVVEHGARGRDRELVNQAVEAVGAARGRSERVLRRALECALRSRGTWVPHAHLVQLAHAIAEGRSLRFRT